MLKYRLYYAALLVFLLVTAYLSSSLLLLLCAAAWLLIPLILKLALTLSARKIQLDCSVRGAGHAGQAAAVLLKAEHARPILSVGMLRVTVRYRNVLFGFEEDHIYELPFSAGQTAISTPMLNELCGKVEIACVRAACFDLLGLCSASVAPFKTTTAVLFPPRLDLSFRIDRSNLGPAPGEMTYLNRRGRDTGEVFDLRAYNPGDDVRSIHWKLSGKLDELVVRENSEPSQDRIALLLDAGLNNVQGAIPHPLISSALGLAALCGGELIDQGTSHQAIFNTRSGLSMTSVANRREQIRLIQAWMEMPLPDQNGIGAELFLAQRLPRRFARLIYITAGAIPENVELLSAQMDVTVLCVTDEVDDIHLADHDRCQLVMLPPSKLHDSNYSLTI